MEVGNLEREVESGAADGLRAMNHYKLIDRALVEFGVRLVELVYDTYPFRLDHSYLESLH